MSQVGRLYAWRLRWFGEPDHVADQLRDIARQGSSMARLAHACAFLLIVLFSAGSLVALGGDALDAIMREWSARLALTFPPLSPSASHVCWSSRWTSACSTQRRCCGFYRPGARSRARGASTRS